MSCCPEHTTKHRDYLAAGTGSGGGLGVRNAHQRKQATSDFVPSLRFYPLYPEETYYVLYQPMQPSIPLLSLKA